MLRGVLLDRFIEKNPLSVMARSIVAAVIDLDLDEVFEQERQRQYDRVMSFSTLAASVAEIALGTLENRNQAIGTIRRNSARRRRRITTS